MSNRDRQRAATLVQMIVAIVLIATFSAILYPVIKGLKEQVAETDDSVKLVAIATKVGQYMATHDEVPPDLEAIQAQDEAVCSLWDGDPRTRAYYQFVYWPGQLARKYADPNVHRNWMNFVSMLAKEDFPVIYCPNHLNKDEVVEYDFIFGQRVPIFPEGVKPRFLGATSEGRLGYFETERLQDRLTGFLFPDGIPEL